MPMTRATATTKLRFRIESLPVQVVLRDRPLHWYGRPTPGFAARRPPSGRNSAMPPAHLGVEDAREIACAQPRIEPGKILLQELGQPPARGPRLGRQQRADLTLLRGRGEIGACHLAGPGPQLP